MAVAYDIKAHPTVYGSRQFRSRLEAKWAAFFDLCGWQFEYEPFDLPGWSPDFSLGGKLLVEVKPVYEMDIDVCRKMANAARAAKWDGELMLVGVAPVFEMKFGPYEGPSIGWLAERATAEEIGKDHDEWWFGSASACISPNGMPDFTHDEMNYTGRMFGVHYKGNHWPDNSDWLKATWDRAANRVQWHKK